MDRSFRIKKNQEFADIISTKQLIKSPCFNIFYKKNNVGHLRFGLSVSKKIGNAVVRNKTKRQLRSFININKKLQNSCYDIVVIPKGEFLKKSYKENLELFFGKVETLI